MNKDGFNHINRLKKNISKINSNKGFTLVELIVVMVVLSIMLTLGGFAILKWQDWATFNQENEYAQTLFVAAQNQLAEYSANGRLETMREKLGEAVDGADEVEYLYGVKPNSGLVLDLKKLTDEDGNTYDDIFDVWKEAHRNEKYTDEIVALRANAGQYSEYESDPQKFEDEHLEAYWVYELLGSYVYDKSILKDAAISIEFTPDDGQVFAVLYSDKNGAFMYVQHGESKEGAVDIEDRQENYRNDRMVGYYGVDTLTKATRDKAKTKTKTDVVIDNVRLNNENTLNLVFDLKEGAVGELNYKVEVLTGKEHNTENVDGAYTKKLEITIPGGSLKKNVDAVECDVVKINEDGTPGALEKMNILCKVGVNDNTNNPQVVMILDAADLHAGANLYKDFLAKEEAHTDVFKDTYSIFRFGIDIEYAKCEVTARDLAGNEFETVSSNVEHMAFETAKTSEGVAEYTITNARHFYNIRYIIQSCENDVANTFSLKSDIDWGYFQKDISSFNHLYDSNIATSGWVTSSLPSELNSVTTCAFPSFSELDDNDVIDTSADENGRKPAPYVLKNFTFDAEANDKYLSAKCYQNTGLEATGLVIKNAGKIDNIVMKNVTVNGADYAGAFAGINNGDLIELSVKNIDAKRISGQNYLGSITGMNDTEGTVDMCQAIAGTIEGGKYIGGLVGYNKNVVENTENRNLNNVATVRGVECVGGAVGYNSSTATIDGLRFKCGLVDGKEQVGGVAGYNAGKIGATHLLKDDISMTPNVTGDYYVGGIVGYNDSNATVTKYIVNKGTIVGREGSCFVGGYVGFNSSIYLLQDKVTKAPHEIISSPSKVTGSYYVGGCIGGNILNTHGYINMVEVDTPVNPVLPGDSSGDKPEDGSVINVGGITVPVTDSLTYGSIKADVDINRNGEGTLYINLQIHNDTGAYYKGPWSIDLSSVKGIGNYVIESNCGNNIYVKDNIIQDGCSGYHDNNIGWTQEIKANEVKEIQITLTHNKIVSDEDIITAIKKAKWDVKYNEPTSNLDSGKKINSNLELLSIVGPTQFKTSNPAPDSGKVWIEVKKVKSNNSYGEYNVIIHNDTSYDLDSWELYLYFTDVVPGEIWGAPYTVQGNTIKYERGNWSNTTIKANSNFTTLAFNVKAGVNGKDYYDNFTTSFSGEMFNLGNKIASLNGGQNSDPTQENPTPEDPTPEENTEAPKINAINALFANSNYMGQLSGEAFVGGYIGYNMLVDSDVAGYVKTVSVSYIDATKSADLAAKYKAVDELANTKPSTVEMRINADSKSVVKNNIGVVSADICVGGIIGYNEADTNLIIYNTQNASYVIANKNIANEDEQKINGVARITTYDNREVGADFYKYSYAGGIIGKVNTKTTIYKCSNNTTALVSGLGTYTGGLAEINDGKITKCEILSFGDGSTDYIGGLCGLNEVNGQIYNCECIEDQTMSGRNVVGMVVAENYGEIWNISFKSSKMVVNGAYVSDGYKDGVAGIFAGYNGYTGDIKLDVDLENVNINSLGRYVGGIVGINAGTITNGKVPANEEDRKESDEDTYFINIFGRINGDSSVGGFIGANNNPDSLTSVEYLRNKAVVTASKGDVGGIIGMNNSANTIRHCQNNAIVAANNSGNAGGITSFNRGTITECQNYRTVLSPKGMCGGIVAINESLNSDEYPELGLIENCTVEAKETPEIVFTSSYTVGGIAAQNGGVIKNNVLNSVKVTNTNAVNGTNMGVIVGENLATGRIYLSNTTESVIGCKVVAESNACNIGGVAGSNEGIITSLANYMDSTNKEKALINPNISLNGSATYGNMGGVAGKNTCVGPNTGIISYCAVDASIKGKLGSSDTGYGGIAGYSSSKDTIESAKISYCTFDGLLNASGSAGTPARVGGITGINGKNSIIEYCLIGQRSEDLANVASSHNLSGRYTLIVAGENAYKKFITYDRTSSITDSPDTNAATYIGGYAGENFGTIYGGNNYTTSDDSEDVHIISFLGDAGGIVGHNNSGAVVTGSKPDSITTVDKFTSDNKLDTVGYDVSDPYNNILSTGEKWYVDQLAIENDHGPGGIIGINNSSNPISYVDNHADVTAQAVANSHTGGFIGHSDTGDISVLKFSYCTNYGDVVSYRHLGGFIGETRMHSASFENCINYGSNISESGCLAGFIGYVHTPGNHFTFNNCINHGEVSSKPGASSSSDIYAGGFIGRVVYARDLNFDFYKCVNTGVVKSARANAGHFVGEFGSGANEKTNFDLCRNYNNYSNELNTLSTPNSEGYYPTRKFVGKGSTVSIYNCFDNSNVIQKNTGTYPFKDGTGNASNNYYLDASSFASINANEFVREGDLGVYFNFNMGNGAAFNVPSDKGYTTVKDPSIYLLKPYLDTYMYTGGVTTEANRKPIFDFSLSYKDSDSVGVDAFTVFLGNSTKNATTALEARNYKLYATYYYLNDDGTYSEINTEIEEASVSGMSMDYKRIDLYNPSSDKKPVKIRINFLDAGNNVCLHGFGYIPFGKNEPYRCNYLGEKNNVYITLSDVVRYDNNNILISNTGIGFTDKDAKLGKNNYLSDYLNMEYLMYLNNDGNHAGYISFNSKKNITAIPNGGRSELVFKVKNDKKNTDISDFVFYLTSNNGSDVKCNYSVIFTDVNGVSMYYSDGNGKEIFEGVGKSNTPENITNNRKVISKPDGLSYISEIKLILYPFTSDNVYLAGFGWIPKNSNSREQKLAPDTLGTISESLRHPAPTISAYTRLNADLTTGNENNGMAGHYYIYHPINPANGFYMDYIGNNPIENATENKGYLDHRIYSESLSVDRKSGSRVDLYYDIDDKVTDLILNSIATNNVLSAPVFNATVEESGAYKFSWAKVNGAAAYEIYYTYEAMEFNEDTGTYDLIEHSMDSVEIGATQNYYYIVPGNNWTKIKFYLKAVHAYNIMNHDTSYDSSVVSTEVEQVKQVLPVPEVHMETVFEDYTKGVASKNKLIAVLDNYEDYLVTDSVTGQVTPLDCTISVYYYNADVDFSFDISNGRYYSEVKTLTQFTNDAEMRCFAMPNESISDTYIRSALIQKFGRGSGNALFNNERYVDTYFNGFYGDDINDMKYEVYYKITGSTQADAYMRTDISALDKKIGLPVAYSTEIAHVAKAVGSGEIITTSTLSNLPVEWFGKDFVDDVLVRSYPHRSQSNMVYFGHDVEIDEATIASLNSDGIITVNGNRLLFDGTEEQIKSALKTITDNKYYDINEDKFSPHPVMDGDELSIGYSLVKNDDGSYTLYYNSLLESSIYQGMNDTTDKYPEYKKFNVTYRHYTKLTADDYASSAWNSANDFQEKMYSNGYSVYNDMDTTTHKIKGVSLKYDDNYRTKKTPNVSTNDYMQEFQPAPIIDGDIVANYDEFGKIISFTVKWDKYFKDVNRWDDTTKYYKHINFSTDYSSIANTWDVYANRINYSTLNDNNKTVALINYYYMYAGREAKYSIELVGYNDLGESFVLSTSTVGANDTSCLQDLGESSVVNGVNEYTHKHDIPVDSSWNYAKYTVRIIRLGETVSTLYELKEQRDVSFNLNNSSQKGESRLGYVLRSGELGSFRLPRYIEEDINLRLPFDQLTKPTMAVHMIDDDGFLVVDSTNLSYDLSFAAIDDLAQEEDLGGYLISMRYVVSEDATPEALPKADSYYYISFVDEDGLDIINLDNADISANITPVRLSIDDGDAVLTPGEYIEVNENGSIKIDAVIGLVNTYEEGDELLVSVKAIAKIDAKTYMDGGDSEATPIIVYDRLEVPNVENVTYDTSSTSENVMKNGTDDIEIEVWKIGEEHKLSINFNDIVSSESEGAEIGKQYLEEDNVSIIMAIAVYDKPVFVDGDGNIMINQNDKSKVVVSGDGIPDEDGIICGDTWDAGSYDVIYGKTDMQASSLVNGAYTIDLGIGDMPEKYAGMWLKIALKATSDTVIDSMWSDEDNDDETINYIWIHLPELEVEDTTTGYICAESIDDTYVSDDDYEYMYSTTQQALIVTIDDNADYYDLSFTKFDDSVQTLKVIREVDEEGMTKWYYESSDNDRIDITDSRTKIDSIENEIEVELNPAIPDDESSFAEHITIKAKAYIRLGVYDLDAGELIDSVEADGLEKVEVFVIDLPDILSWETKDKEGLDKEAVAPLDSDDLGSDADGYFAIKQFEAVAGLNSQSDSHKEYKYSADGVVWKREDTISHFALFDDDLDDTDEGLEEIPEEEIPEEEIPEEEILDEENLDDSSFDEENLDESESESEQEDPVDTPEGIIPDESTSGGDTPAGDESGSEEHDDNSEDGSNGSSEGSDTEE